MTGWRVACCLPVILGLLLPPAAAVARGDIRLSTWNLDWLTTRPQGDAALPADVTPRTAAELERLAAYARRLAPDIAALEEVDSPELAARLFPAPGYHILVSHDPVVQKVALAIRTGLAVTRHADVTALDVYPPDAPRHLRSGLDVSIGTGADSLRVLVVHLKAGCRDSGPDSRKPACHTLLRQIAVITDWILERQDEGEAFAVIGDFNRLLAPDDPALRSLASSGPLTLATAGHASPCAGGSYFIDHILLGGPARAWLQPDSLRVMLYGTGGHEDAIRLSDHCPVSVRLSLP
ncbi:endonuclease/exonuclease/phosphatase family protein [Komagataeibacter sp. FNDCF1]|uniref:endonuclease/exonuclease/phosphatase family protein n=1 Tax=Komagataeibacter sp. FNDCF1 TaxID=2878681 RepID=UPI001E5DB9CD|nr:endonuclease/exonuclease/phosphatase family protein [Komagataeibacter sp. FNDCF1]MCE2565900.1 endonuclease/exonuclease/phosphatase family protein [Komagataeibacter sp. FNDCF1]